jgi:hypothetical protein
MVFAMVGLVVIIGVEIFKKYNSAEVMIFEVGDVTDLLFKIDVFGNNKASSPLKIIEVLDQNFLEVSGVLTFRQNFQKKRRNLKKN